ncbi:hypothetical protein HGG71_02185 [Rhodobacteraceae bacterium R_SAG2]|nr:hypothetical protein [Rhodobacteraceae bacterium R_SAG2]
MLAQSLGMIPETTSNDIDVIFALVLSGVYLGFAPIHSIAALYPGQRVRRLPVSGGDCHVPFHICTRRAPQQARRTRLFLKVLQATTGAPLAR